MPANNVVFLVLDHIVNISKKRLDDWSSQKEEKKNVLALLTVVMQS